MNKTFSIYQILFPNGKRYVGQTINIRKRWREHIYEASIGTDFKVYRAMRKYKITIDAFSIIEENILTHEEANAKEIYYIALYDSYYNGYNSTKGGDSGFQPFGEDHPKAKLTNKDILEIRQIRASKIYTFAEVYEFYKDKSSYSGLSKIWNYESRVDIGSELNTEELRSFYKLDHRQRRGENHVNSKITDDEVVAARKAYFVDGYKMKEIYEKFKDKYSLSGFRKIVLGTSFTHIPIPQKTAKCKKKRDWLTKEQVIFIRQKYSEGYKIMEIIKNWFPECSQTSINLIVHNKRYVDYK